MENNKNKKSVKFQGDMLNFCDFIHVFVFTRNHHLNSCVNLCYRFSKLISHLQKSVCKIEECYSGACASTDTSDPSVMYIYLLRLDVCLEIEEIASVLEKPLKISTQIPTVLLDNAIFLPATYSFHFVRIFFINKCPSNLSNESL